MAEGEKQTSTDVDFRVYLRAIVAFKWLIVAVTVVVAAVVLLVTFKLPRIYEATTTIEYDPSPTRPLGQDLQDVADPIGGFWSAREFFATQNRIISSRGVAERVIRRLGLHEDPTYVGSPERGAFEAAEPANLVDRVLSNLNVAPVKDTRLVRIVFRDTSPERARAVADAFADVYIEKTLEDRMASTVSALEWLGSQLDQLRRDLDGSELALHSFKEEHNVLSLSMEDRQNLVAGEIQALSASLTQVRQRRIEVAARVGRLREALSGSGDIAEASAVVFDERSGVAGLRDQLRVKLAERQRLDATYGAAHPRMAAISQEIEALQEQLRREVDSIIRSADADLREVRAIEAGLTAALDQAHAAGLALNLRSIEYNRLSREQENKSKLYQLVLQRTTEADLTRMLRTTHVRLVDRAQRPLAPVSPNRVLNGAVGILGGLLLGILLALGIRLLDRRVRGPEVIEELGVTILGVLPVVGEASHGEARRPRRRSRQTESPELVVHDSPMSMAAECCRTIRTNLIFTTIAASGKRVLAVTSSHPREGKTTVASNLAASIAQSGKRVVVIDTDLRKPRLHQALGISREVGVSTFIVGEASFDQTVHETRVPGLSAIPSGPVPPNPAELLHTPRFQELLRHARERFDVVIFDTPPIGTVTDAAIIGPQVDGVILVVRANQTTRDALAAAVRQLRDVGAKVAGAIVNGFDFRSEGYYGSTYYYRKYGEYYADEPAESEKVAAE